jgi:uncharacterized protein
VEKELTGILNRIVDRIINTAHPSRIILFGSAAAGTMKENSDFDLLVIMKNNVHRRTTSHLIYQSISDIGFATDIIVVTEDDIKFTAEYRRELPETGIRRRQGTLCRLRITHQLRTGSEEQKVI